MSDRESQGKDPHVYDDIVELDNKLPLAGERAG